MLPESRLRLFISLKIQSFLSDEEKHNDENTYSLVADFGSVKLIHLWIRIREATAPKFRIVVPQPASSFL